MSEHDDEAISSRLHLEPDGKYNGNEAKYVLEALDSENPKNKEVPWASRLEAAFASRLGAGFAIAHNSGTSTLHSCLAAAGVGQGDEVIVPAHTVIMCAWSALYQNAIPVFADSDPTTFNIDPTDVERKLTSRTKAIIVVHMHGLPADMDGILAIARPRGIKVIEDCAQCVLGTIDGRIAGTMGDFGSFSFETKKHLSSGEGGMVSTNDPALATKVRKHAGLGYKTLSAGAGLRNILPVEFQDPAYKRHDTLAWNYRMPELIAAVALAQLERVDDIVQRRIEVGKMYLEAVKDCDWLIPQRVPDGYVHSYWAFTLRYEGEDAHGVGWKNFWKLLKSNGGDGFYGALSLAYDEIAMRERRFYGTYLKQNEEVYPGGFEWHPGLCPDAEAFQPKLMKFKTNYRNLEEARRKIDILKDTILQVERRGV